MSKWQIATVAILAVAPILLLVGVGIWWFWMEGWMLYAWWPMTACLASSYVLGWWWQRRALLPGRPCFEPPQEWTDRDREAWRLVERRAHAVKSVSAQRLKDIQFYIRTAQEMALELAQFYHPQADDPIGSVTIPELLAVFELAAHDLAEMVDDYLPAGHLLTIDNWRRTEQVTRWYQQGRNMYWAVSAILSPFQTATRYAASRVGLGVPFKMLQEILLAWFHVAFLNRVGTYLIVLNSGRLRVGAARYRELLEQARSHESAPAAIRAGVQEVTLSVVGQVKAGKSSLVNAILDDCLADVDVLPTTNAVTRYEYQLPGSDCRVVLLDTVGYSHNDADADQLDATREAVRSSDAVLMVFHSHDPARQADLEFLEQISEWFELCPELRRPPVLGVLTHIDLLFPSLEWDPPYDWILPSRRKERSIHNAVVVADEQLGSHLVAAVPVCLAEEKVYGVDEWLMPQLVGLLGEARAVCLLRCLRAEAETGKLRKVLGQLMNVSKRLVGTEIPGS